MTVAVAVAMAMAIDNGGASARRKRSIIGRVRSRDRVCGSCRFGVGIVHSICRQFDFCGLSAVDVLPLR